MRVLVSTHKCMYTSMWICVCVFVRAGSLHIASTFQDHTQFQFQLQFCLQFQPQHNGKNFRFFTINSKYISKKKYSDWTTQSITKGCYRQQVIRSSKKFSFRKVLL